MSKMIDITKEKSGVFGHMLADAEKGDRLIYHVGQHCGGVHRRDAAKASDEGQLTLGLFFSEDIMAKFEVDMSKVDEKVARDVAHEILLFFADIQDEGVNALEMIVALGIVMEIMIEQDRGQVAHTRSH
jgi:hypothetical protein